MTNIAIVASTVQRATRIGTTLGVSAAVFSKTAMEAIRGQTFDAIIVDESINEDDAAMDALVLALSPDGDMLCCVSAGQGV